MWFQKLVDKWESHPLQLKHVAPQVRLRFEAGVERRNILHFENKHAAFRRRVYQRGTHCKGEEYGELAAEFDVPVLEYPALARSVYFTTRENQIIRDELYVAVAALVAFVFSLKRGEYPPRPNVTVPVALRFDTEGRQTDDQS